MLNMLNESFIDHKYRRQLFSACLREPRLTRLNGNTTWMLECPLCGASGSHLVWMDHKSTWKFLCSTKSKRNCQSQLEFPVLLREWNPGLFLTYMQEREASGTAGAGFNCPRPSPHHRKRKQLDLPTRAKCQDQSEPTGISTSS